jgi:hypothetical protein
MKIKCEITMDTETGDYELTFYNLSTSEEPMEYGEMNAILKKIFTDVDKQVDGTGMESTDNFTKLIN